MRETVWPAWFSPRLAYGFAAANAAVLACCPWMTGESRVVGGVAAVLWVALLTVGAALPALGRLSPGRRTLALGALATLVGGWAALCSGLFGEFLLTLDLRRALQSLGPRVPDLLYQARIEVFLCGSLGAGLIWLRRLPGAALAALSLALAGGAYLLSGHLATALYALSLPASCCLAIWMSEEGLNHSISTAVERGELVASEAAARQLIAAQPHSGGAHCVLGIALAAQKDWQGAEDSLDRALDCPRPGPAANRLGCLLLARGDLAGAELVCGDLERLFLRAAQEGRPAEQVAGALGLAPRGPGLLTWALAWADWDDPRLRDV